MMLGLGLILVGIPFFVKYAPKKEIEELKAEWLSPSSILEGRVSKRKGSLPTC
jgi:hypothetical protein